MYAKITSGGGSIVSAVKLSYVSLTFPVIASQPQQPIKKVIYKTTIKSKPRKRNYQEEFVQRGLASYGKKVS